MALVGSVHSIFAQEAVETQRETVFEWSADSALVNPSDINQTIGRLLEQDAFRLDGVFGEQRVPVTHQLVELPVNTNVKIDVVSSSETRLSFSELSSQAFPAEQIVFEEMGIMAGTRYGRLSFYPLHQTANGSGLNLTTHIEVDLIFTPQETKERRIEFDAQSAGSPEAIIEATETGIMELTYADLLSAGVTLDGRSPAGWQIEASGGPISIYFDGDSDEVFESNERFLFYVPELPNRWTNKKIFTLRYLEGQSGARMVEDSLVAGSGGTSGQLIGTLLLEEDSIYTPNCTCGILPAGRDGDRWAWKELRKPVVEPSTIPFELDDADVSQSAEITVWTIGYTDSPAENDHGLSVWLNGNDLGDLIWDGKTAYTETLTIPSNTLQATNVITLALDGGADQYGGVWLDAVEVRYRVSSNEISAGEQYASDVDAGSDVVTFSQQSNSRLWGLELSDQTSPILFRAGNNQTGSIRIAKDSAAVTTYQLAYESDLIAPSAIRTPNPVTEAQGDYVVIAPDAYHASLNSLFNLREKEGWQPVVASLEGINDQYGYGQPDPDGIYNYLYDGYHNWTVRPKAVLLVGDGTSDPKQNQTNSKASVLPIFMASVDPEAGEVAADNRYALLDGNDLLPDVAIGRLPVNSVDELNIVISKLMAYQAAGDNWRDEIAFIADDQDDAGDFTKIYTSMATPLATAGFNSQQISLAADEANLPQVKEDVRSLLQDGVGHLVFSGHSTVHQWAVEEIFHFSQIGSLENGAKLPILLQMTCLTGSFHMPGLDSFDEAMVRQPDGGAVAVWGSSGLGIALGHEELSAGYFETFLNNESATIGEAVLNGKLHLMTNRAEKADLIDSFNLLGDPAMLFSPTVNPSFSIYLPIIPGS